MKQRFAMQYGIGMLFLLMIIGPLGCAGGPAAPQAQQPAAASRADPVDWSLLSDPGKRELSAVAGFENRSTYSADRLWDTSSQMLASALLRAGYFRVVEWEKMKQLFDWDTLSQASIVKSPENLKKAQRIILCEYFISGAITSFDVSQHSKVSALSKKKWIDTAIRVDLLLQDARSGEYLATGKGFHKVRQAYEGGLAGGQTGTWNAHAADQALSSAIDRALFELIENFHRTRN